MSPRPRPALGAKVTELRPRQDRGAPGAPCWPRPWTNNPGPHRSDQFPAPGALTRHGARPIPPQDTHPKSRGFGGSPAGIPGSGGSADPGRAPKIGESSWDLRLERSRSREGMVWRERPINRAESRS